MNNNTLPPTEIRTLTGFPSLDEITDGLRNGDLIVIAARPGIGDMPLAADIAEHIALNQKLHVALFLIAEDAAWIAKRILKSCSPTTENMTHSECLRPSEAIEKLRAISIHVEDTADTTLSVLAAKARNRSKQFGKLGLVVVDYLQLVNGHKPVGETRMFSVGEMCGLKLLAKELQCPVIVLSQVNRSLETRRDKRPKMSDLRKVSILDRYADVIMLIYRDEFYLKDASKDPGVAEIIIAKQRNGPTGTVKLAFDRLRQKFKPLGEGK